MVLKIQGVSLEEGNFFTCETAAESLKTAIFSEAFKKRFETSAGFVEIHKNYLCFYLIQL